jgi:hypothetical protein
MAKLWKELSYEERSDYVFRFHEETDKYMCYMRDLTIEELVAIEEDKRFKELNRQKRKEYLLRKKVLINLILVKMKYIFLIFKRKLKT